MSEQITPNPSVPSQVVAEVKFPRFINNLGIIPTSYKDSMSYYECLAWLCKFLEEQVIPTVNENGEAVEELQALYIELNEYVTNYFDTLDVQEEINNKLDDMVEAGTLQEIIADYLNSKAVFGFDTIQDMKSATNLIDGSFAKTLGFYSKNDYGSGLYKIRKITNDDTIDEMTIIALNDVENQLIAELIIDSKTNPKTLGAYGDGIHDDIIPIQKCINLKNEVSLSKGTYFISESITINSNNIFNGNNYTIKPNTNIIAFSIIGNGINNAITKTTLKNINIDTSNAGSSGIYLKDGYFNYFENVNIQPLTGNDVSGITIINGFNHIFKEGRILGTTGYTGQIGLNISSTNNNNGIENMTNNKYDSLLIQRVQYGVKTNYLTTCNITDFINLGFSACTYAFYLQGNARPLTIHNARIEKAEASSDTYGIYIHNDGITSYIDSLNIYNITYPIYNNSTGEIYISGACTFTGTTQNPKFNIIKSNGNVVSNANIYFTSTTYNFMNSSSLATGKFYADSNGFIDLGNTITSDNFDIRNNNRIYKTTNRIFNLFGIRGYEALIYTDTTGLVIQTSDHGSTSSLLTGDNIEMQPNVLYHFKFLDNNKWTLIN